jgi:putative Mn2+ efflux pump MntP
MPVFGWFIGEFLSAYINIFDHWIAFVLLGVVGIKMIKESLEPNEEKVASLSNKRVLVLALATSIDALIVGLTLKYLDLPLILSALVIGVVTLVLCMGGYYLGKKVGLLLEGKIEAIGGAVLILLGAKILIQHLFIP